MVAYPAFLNRNESNNKSLPVDNPLLLYIIKRKNPQEESKERGLAYTTRTLRVPSLALGTDRKQVNASKADLPNQKDDKQL